MKKFFTIKLLIILTAVTALLVIISYFFKLASPPPAVINSDPSLNSTQVNFYDPIRLEFDKPVDPELIGITSNPAETWSVKVIGPYSVTLEHSQYFRVDTDYSVSITYGGEPVYTLDFKTAHQQSDPRYAQEVVSGMKQDYPLATVFPYETQFFRAVYSSPLTIQITPKTGTLSNEEILKQVRAWVSQNGLDPDTHKYAIAPSQTPPNLP